MGWEMHFAVVERDAKYCEKNTIYRKKIIPGYIVRIQRQGCYI